MVSVLYVVSVTVASSVIIWYLPHMGPFPSRFFCQEHHHHRCSASIKIVSILLHSVAIAYAWTFLLSVNILEMAHAMYLEEGLKVPITLAVVIGSYVFILVVLIKACC